MSNFSFFSYAQVTPYSPIPPSDRKVDYMVKDIVFKLLNRNHVSFVDKHGISSILDETFQKFEVRPLRLGRSPFYNYKERERELSHFEKSAEEIKNLYEVVLRNILENEEVQKIIPEHMHLKLDFKIQKHIWNNYTCQVFAKIILERLDHIPAASPT